MLKKVFTFFQKSYQNYKKSKEINKSLKNLWDTSGYNKRMIDNFGELFKLSSVIFYFPLDKVFGYEKYFNSKTIYYVKSTTETPFSRWFEKNYHLFTPEWQSEKGVDSPLNINFLSEKSFLENIEDYAVFIGNYLFRYTEKKEEYLSLLKEIFNKDIGVVGLQKIFFNEFLKVGFTENTGGGLLRFFEICEYNVNKAAFAYTKISEIDNKDESYIEEVFVQYLKYISSKSIFDFKSLDYYQLIPKEEDKKDTADNNFEEYMNMLVDEVADKINLIKEKGYLPLLIQKVGIEILEKKIELAKMMPFPMSRIKVSKNNEIFLLDYGNLMLDLPPIEKTIYLFFLKREKKILLKNLIDYKDEILSIYLQNAYVKDYRKSKKVIEKLLDTRENSINEKLSKIKNIILKTINPLVAHHYYISGQRGSEKGISLPKEMIIWEE